jgi:hypothetical protein
LNVCRFSLLLAIVGLSVGCADNDQDVPAEQAQAESESVESVGADLFVDDFGQFDRVVVTGSDSRPPNRRSETNQFDRSLSFVMPLLPGVSGFDWGVFSNANMLGEDPPLKLAAEEWDREWAEDMEDRIRFEIAETVNEQITLIDVVCRKTMCGVLYSMPPGTSNVNTASIERDGIPGILKGTLGFTETSNVLGSSRDGLWVAIFAENDP